MLRVPAKMDSNRAVLRLHAGPFDTGDAQWRRRTKRRGQRLGKGCHDDDRKTRSERRAQDQPGPVERHDPAPHAIPKIEGQPDQNGSCVLLIRVPFQSRRALGVLVQIV